MLVLIWNKDSVKTEFEIEYGKLFEYITKDIKRVLFSEDERKGLFNKFYEKIVIENTIENDFDETVGGFFSGSNAPKENTDQYTEIYKKIRVLFDQYNINGIVNYNYDTEVYIGKL